MIGLGSDKNGNQTSANWIDDFDRMAVKDFKKGVWCWPPSPSCMQAVWKMYSQLRRNCPPYSHLYSQLCPLCIKRLCRCIYSLIYYQCILWFTAHWTGGQYKEWTQTIQRIRYLVLTHNIARQSIEEFRYQVIRLSTYICWCLVKFLRICVRRPG